MAEPENKLTLVVQSDDGNTQTKHDFYLAPTIGHCIELKSRGIDLLAVDTEAASIEAIVADPVKFMQVVEVVIGSNSDQFRMPALAGLMSGDTWKETRAVTLRAFRDFFQSSGYPHLAAVLDRLEAATQAVTAKVADVLNGDLMKKEFDRIVSSIDKELEKAVNELSDETGD